MIKLNLTLRRLISRPVTTLRKHRKIIKKIPLINGDVWRNAKKEENYASLYEDYAVDFGAMIAAPRRKIGLISLPDDAAKFYFEKSCRELEIDFQFFNPLSKDFIRNIKDSNIVDFLTRPANKTQLLRQMFFEKLEIVSNDLKRNLHPSLAEQKIYEAKRVLAYFLDANCIPHPRTWVFYDKEEAVEFLSTASLPLVFKAHNGASAQGVEIINTRHQGRKLINACFDHYYINKALSDYRDIDYGYVILQEFLEDIKEHRIIKIGDSWMGHQKALSAGSHFMSGSGITLWTAPPVAAFDFCREIAQKHGFSTMCFDVFESNSKRLLVNELQTWFGSYNPSQMYINGIPGRFVFRNGHYSFERGLFNHNQGLSLRIVELINRGGKLP